MNLSYSERKRLEAYSRSYIQSIVQSIVRSSFLLLPDRAGEADCIINGRRIELKMNRVRWVYGVKEHIKVFNEKVEAIIGTNNTIFPMFREDFIVRLHFQSNFFEKDKQTLLRWLGIK